MFKRFALAAVVVMALFGLAGPASAIPTASNDGVSVQATTGSGRAWNAVEYADGTDGEKLAFTATCQKLAGVVLTPMPVETTFVRSAALIDNANTIEFYNSPAGTCDAAQLVAVLNAGNKADSGFVTGAVQTRMGSIGATHYTAR